MDLSEKDWDEAKQFGQYLMEQGDDESEAVVEFRRQDLAAYLEMMGFCHKGSDDVQLDAAKGTAAIAWGWLWHVTTADDRVKTGSRGEGPGSPTHNPGRFCVSPKRGCRKKLASMQGQLRALQI